MWVAARPSATMACRCNKVTLVLTIFLIPLGLAAALKDAEFQRRRAKWERQDAFAYAMQKQQHEAQEVKQQGEELKRNMTAPLVFLAPEVHLRSLDDPSPLSDDCFFMDGIRFPKIKLR
jgi:hypothetical protein